MCQWLTFRCAVPLWELAVCACDGAPSLREAGAAVQHVLVAGFLLPTFSLDGRPLLVRGGVAAGDDVGEVLRGAGALCEVGHVVREGIEDALR